MSIARAVEVIAIHPELEDAVKNLTIVRKELPQPRRGQAVVEVRGAGVNFAEVLQTMGKYQDKAKPPYIPGFEFSGVVRSVGPSVTNVTVGDRVYGSVHGSFTTLAMANAAMLIRIPENMSFEEAAAWRVTYGTSYLGLVIRGGLTETDTVLVHAGAGGVGSAAVQIAKALGCTVIATVGSQAKADVATAAGADHVINYEENPKFAKEVKRLTRNKGVNLVYDAVGGDAFDESLRCMAWRGRLVVVGFASGRVPTVKANRFLLKGITITGVWWGHAIARERGLDQEITEALHALYQKGSLRPIIYNTYTLEQVGDAFKDLATRKTFGKAVLTPCAQLNSAL